ncbi:MAG: uL15 family ribosomal protein [Candidatus Micrarchaeota archaeon]|nr:uL15 family ribosomal protein [Candidatus Micrarchaeota archaeon]
MTRRYKKKIGKYRGTRSCGGGNAKNRRGSGNKGGKGNAGKGKHNKHKWTYVVVYERDRIGRRGFIPLTRERNDLDAINLWEINRMVEEGKLQKEKDRYVLDFNGKILGSGFIKYPMKVKAASITDRAKKKIESKGGIVEATEIPKE